MKSASKLIAAVAAAAMLFGGGVAQATSMIPVNLATIVEYTEAAFVGKAVSVEIVQTADGWADKVTMTVTEPILGKVEAGQEIVWHQARTTEQVPIPGMPGYAAGREYLIFLSRKGEGTQFQAPFALGQGAFDVIREGGAKPAVRNQFMNATLFTGLDMEKVATAAVQADPATRSLSGQARSQAVTRKRAAYGAARPGASSLSAIKEIAKTLAADPKPSQTFASQGADRPAVAPFVLQAH